MSTEPKLGTCSNPRHAPGRYLVRNPHEKLDDCDDWREGESAAAQPTITLSQGGPTMPSGLAWLEGNKTEPLLSSPQAEAVPPAAETAPKCEHCNDTGWLPETELLVAEPCDCRAETAMTAEQLAQLFHETYERLAPQFGYKTREESAKPWADVPKPNKLLMTAVCAEVAAHVREAAQGDAKKWHSEWQFAMDGVRQWADRAKTAERKLAEVEKALRDLLDATKENWQCNPPDNCGECEIIQPIFKRAEAALASLRAESKEG